MTNYLDIGYGTDPVSLLSNAESRIAELESQLAECKKGRDELREALTVYSRGQSQSLDTALKALIRMTATAVTKGK